MIVPQSGWLENVGVWLGRTPESELDLARMAEKGLPTDVTRSMTEHGLTQGEVNTLVIPARPLKHRRSRREPLSRDESDKLARLVRVFDHAVYVFGGPERARAWLDKPKKRFDNRTPLAMLRTEVGGRMVEEMLGQIDEGMFA